MIQELRAINIQVIRQPTLVVIDQDGKRFVYFPDLLIVAGRCLVEVDGLTHLLRDRFLSDAARQNRLIGFHLFRYPASVIFDDATRVAREIADHVRRFERVPVAGAAVSWVEAGRRIEGLGNEWQISPCRLSWES